MNEVARFIGRTLRPCLAVAFAILAAVLPRTGFAGAGVPGLYQKIYSGNNVTEGDPADGGDIIAAGASFLAMNFGNPSISFTDPETSTKYTLGGQQTVGYKGVMKLTAGTTYTFVKNFDDTGHVWIVTPDGVTTNQLIDSKTHSDVKYGSITPTETGYHTLILYFGNGSGNVGPQQAPFTSSPYASCLWNDSGLTSCTTANRAQWHRLVNNEDSLGVYLYTDVPDADWPAVTPGTTTINADGEATVSFVLTEGKADLSVEASDEDGNVTSAVVGSGISASATVLSGTITGLTAGKSYAINIHAVTAAEREYDFDAGSVYFGNISVAAGVDADSSKITPGTFVISRPSNSDVTFAPLEVSYTCNGATPGTHYAELSGNATIPAGASSVTVRVWPLLYGAGDQDLTLTLISGLNYFVGTESATIKILGSETTQAVRFVSTTGDDDNNDGLSLGTAFKSLSHALTDVASLDAATIMVAPGLYETASMTALSSADKNHYVITTGISVIGMGDRPEDTHFRGTGTSSTRCRVFYLDHANAKLKNLLISAGTSTQKDGGNVCMASSGGTVEDCVISNGWTHSWSLGGGGLYMAAGRVLRTTFVANLTDRDAAGYGMGSAVRMEGGYIENSLFKGNGDGLGGHSGYGVIHMKGSCTLANCTIAGNTGREGAGVVLEGTSPLVYNCAIFDNDAMSDGTGHSGVYYLYSNAKASQFVNCAADREINSTCIYASNGGFANQNGGDFHLAASSVCRDAADETYYAEPQVTSATDLDGNARLTGEKRGTALDIGCYEFDALALSIDFNLDSSIGLMEYDGGLKPVTATFHVSKSGGSGDITYSWDFDNDGTVDLVSSDTTVTHDYTAVGTYTVKLSATDSSGSATSIKTDCYSVAPKMLYVDASSTGASAPYATRATAAKNVTDAYNSALDGSLILVAPGTYEYTSKSSRLNITKSVRIIAEGDTPEDTIFTNSLYSTTKNTTGTFFRLMNSKAVVANMYFTCCSDYSYAAGSGITVEAGGGMVSNCVFRHCGTRNHTNQAGGATVRGGLVTHCIFDDCYFTTTGSTNDRRAQGAYITGSGCVANCLFKNCHSDSSVVIVDGTDATMNNCSIVDCSVTYWTGNECNSTKNRFRYAGAAVELVVGQSGKVYNVAVANVSRCQYDSYDTGGLAKGSCVTNVMPATNCAAWNISNLYNPSQTADTGNRFQHCISEDATPVNDTCFVGSRDTFFRDYANGDYRSSVNGPLCDKGYTLEGQSDIIDLAGRKRVLGSSVDIGAYETGRGLKLIIR